MIQPNNIFFNAYDEGEKIDVEIFVKDKTAAEMDDHGNGLKQLCYLILDTVVGEYDLMTLVGTIDFRDWAAKDQQSKPIAELPQLIDHKLKTKKHG
jgi:hypothetical protein